MSSSYDANFDKKIKNPELRKLAKDIFDTVAGHDHDGVNTKVVAVAVGDGTITNDKMAADAKVGSLAALTTTAKGSLQAAINELDGEHGDLATLTTTAKNTLVEAINELDADVAAITPPTVNSVKKDLNGTTDHPFVFGDVATAGKAESSNTETFDLTSVGSGGTLIFTPDAAAAETFTFNFAAGSSVSGAAPSTDITGETDTKFNISVDGSAAQEVTIALAGLNSGALIAAAIEAAIQALGGVFASVTCDYNVTVAGKYCIASGTQGTGSSVVITPAAAGSLTEELKLGVAGGGTETAGTGPVSNSAAATADELADHINTTAANLTASAVGGKVVITSNTTGKDSKVTVGNGTLNAIIGFTNTDVFHGGQALGIAAPANANYIVQATINGATPVAVAVSEETTAGFTVTTATNSALKVNLSIFE